MPAFTLIASDLDPIRTQPEPALCWKNPKEWRLIINELKAIVGASAVLTTEAERHVYECDACLLVKTQPDCIVLPTTTEHVAAIAKLAHTHHIPLTPRGAGTGLSGGALTPDGGLLMSLNRMTTIQEIHLENQTATVQAGVINGNLNKALAHTHLFFAPDPSSQSASTLGGNIAENAGGIHCVKYGVTHQHILALECVLANGDVIHVGNDSGIQSGINLIQLLCGSEGTLGIITEATVKLTPHPEQRIVFLSAFPTIQHAGDCVSQVIQLGLNPAAIEFIDAFTVKAVNQAFDVGFPESSAAVLLIELDGTKHTLHTQRVTLLNQLKAHQALDIREATDDKERQQLWQARKKAVAAYGRFYPAFYLHDCVIPRSQISDILTRIEAIGLEYNVPIGNVFHAGDGNLHPNILFDPTDTAMVDRVLQAGEKVLEACLSVGGTLSGEHGIGLEKQAFMDRIFTPDDLTGMQHVKNAFDPNLQLNPSKIFPQRRGCGETHLQTADIQRQHLTPSPTDLEHEGLWI